MYAIVFRMVGGTYSAHGDIPSPGRVVGALLHTAYASGDEEAVSEVRKLALCPQPIISARMSSAVTSSAAYTGSNPMLDKQDGSRKALRDLTIPGIDGGRTLEQRTIRGIIAHDSRDAHFSYLVTGDNAPNRDVIERVCHKVTHFGLGQDIALAYTADELPEGRIYRYAPSLRNGGHRMRLWSQSLLDYYDVSYEMEYVHMHTAAYPDEQVETGVWLEVSHQVTDEEEDLVVVPLKWAVGQRNLPSIMPEGSGAFPLVDRRGFVRGIALPFDAVRPEWVAQNVINEQEGPSLATHNIDTWAASTNRWISATPYAGHQDPRVVVWEMQQAGFTVERIHEEPFHYSQGTLGTALRAPLPYKSWYLQLSGPKRPGVLRLGHHQNIGAGVFRPVLNTEDKDVS